MYCRRGAHLLTYCKNSQCVIGFHVKDKTSILLDNMGFRYYFTYWKWNLLTFEVHWRISFVWGSYRPPSIGNNILDLQKTISGILDKDTVGFLRFMHLFSSGVFTTMISEMWAFTTGDDARGAIKCVKLQLYRWSSGQWPLLI